MSTREQKEVLISDSAEKLTLTPKNSRQGVSTCLSRNLLCRTQHTVYKRPCQMSTISNLKTPLNLEERLRNHGNQDYTSPAKTSSNIAFLPHWEDTTISQVAEAQVWWTSHPSDGLKHHSGQECTSPPREVTPELRSLKTGMKSNSWLKSKKEL